VVRQAARRVTQLYDQFLMPVGLRITQFSILAKLKRLGPKTRVSAIATGSEILLMTAVGQTWLSPGVP
jgi:hypothetical protein